MCLRFGDGRMICVTLLSLFALGITIYIYDYIIVIILVIDDDYHTIINTIIIIIIITILLLSLLLFYYWWWRFMKIDDGWCVLRVPVTFQKIPPLRQRLPHPTSSLRRKGPMARQGLPKCVCDVRLPATLLENHRKNHRKMVVFHGISCCWLPSVKGSPNEAGKSLGSLGVQ